MRCKSLYYMSPAVEKRAEGRDDPLVIVGGLCRKRFPIGLWCFKEDYHYLCRGKGYEARGESVMIESPVEIPPVVEPPTVEPIVEPEPVVEPPRKHKRGRPVGRQ